MCTTQGVKQDPMDDHAGSALHYGHVGRAVYLPETKTWIFARSFIQPPAITYTGQTSQTVPSPCHNNQLRPPSPKRSRHADERLILDAHPELAADWSFIRNDAYSRAVTSAVNKFDPLVSTLLDLGYALDYASQDATAIPGPLAIAAVVTGDSRNAISFRMMVGEMVELPYEHSTVHVPTIGGAETTEWSRWGQPILQIRFAHSVEGKSTWMAARLPGVTTVFRPIYHRSAVPMRIHDEDIAAVSGPLRNSRIDANPVVEVKKSSTGGFTHADVSFNPWYPRQFAIVDIRGNWSVWEVTGRQRRRTATWAANIVTIGSLPFSNEMLDNNLPRHDGWASIEWITDFSTLLVCDRRSAMLFQMSGKDIYSKVVELDMEKPSEWVLNVKRGIENTCQFFVLTTSRLLWFDTSTAPFVGKRVGPPLRCRLTWRHFRDPEDLTLRLSDLRVNGEVYLILYSQLAGMVQLFPLPSLVDEQTEMGSVSDPFILDAPASLNHVSAGDTSSPPYSTFVFREVGHSPGSGPTTHYNPNMTLIKLFWSDSSLAVHEALFKGTDGNREINEDGLAVENRADSHLLIVKRHVTQRKENDLDDETFVVDDWDESVAVSGINRHPANGKTSSPDLRWNADPQWSLDWVSVYAFAVINSAAIASQGDHDASDPTLRSLIERVRSDPTEALASFRASETMLELSGTRPVLNDIDDGADDFSHLVSTVLPEVPDFHAPYRYQILPLQFSKRLYGMPTPPAQLGLDYLETYNQLVDEWVSSVPHGTHGIPNQTRVSKEKTARMVALDILLSRLIRIYNVPRDKNAHQTGELAISNRTMNESVASSQALSTQLESSQVASGPKQATRESSSESQTNEAHDDSSSPAVSTPNFTSLAMYTTFEEPRPMPRNVTNLLCHWQMGSDPSNYAWQRISQLLDDEEVQRTPAPARPRHRVRKKRSQLTPAPDAASLPPTPVAPMVRTWGSQPDHSGPKLPLTSSQPTVDEMPMTQTERGNFGARVVKKSSKLKKKRRAAGF